MKILQDYQRQIYLKYLEAMFKSISIFNAGKANNEIITDIFELETLEAGKILYKEGEECDYIYFIVKGNIRLTVSKYFLLNENNKYQYIYYRKRSKSKASRRKQKRGNSIILVNKTSNTANLNKVINSNNNSNKRILRVSNKNLSSKKSQNLLINQGNDNVNVNTEKKSNYSKLIHNLVGSNKKLKSISKLNSNNESNGDYDGKKGNNDNGLSNEDRQYSTNNIFNLKFGEFNINNNLNNAQTNNIYDISIKNSNSNSNSDLSISYNSQSVSRSNSAKSVKYKNKLDMKILSNTEINKRRNSVCLLKDNNNNKKTTNYHNYGDDINNDSNTKFNNKKSAKNKTKREIKDFEEGTEEQQINNIVEMKKKELRGIYKKLNKYDKQILLVDMIKIDMVEKLSEHMKTTKYKSEKEFFRKLEDKINKNYIRFKKNEVINVKNYNNSTWLNDNIAFYKHKLGTYSKFTATSTEQTIVLKALKSDFINDIVPLNVDTSLFFVKSSRKKEDLFLELQKKAKKEALDTFLSRVYLKEERLLSKINMLNKAFPETAVSFYGRRNYEMFRLRENINIHRNMKDVGFDNVNLKKELTVDSNNGKSGLKNKIFNKNNNNSKSKNNNRDSQSKFHIKIKQDNKNNFSDDPLNNLVGKAKSSFNNSNNKSPTKNLNSIINEDNNNLMSSRYNNSSARINHKKNTSLIGDTPLSKRLSLKRKNICILGAKADSLINIKEFNINKLEENQSMSSFSSQKLDIKNQSNNNNTKNKILSNRKEVSVVYPNINNNSKMNNNIVNINAKNKEKKNEKISRNGFKKSNVVHKDVMFKEFEKNNKKKTIMKKVLSKGAFVVNINKLDNKTNHDKDCLDKYKNNIFKVKRDSEFFAKINNKSIFQSEYSMGNNRKTTNQSNINFNISSNLDLVENKNSEILFSKFNNRKISNNDEDTYNGNNYSSVKNIKIKHEDSNMWNEERRSSPFLDVNANKNYANKKKAGLSSIEFHSNLKAKLLNDTNLHNNYFDNNKQSPSFYNNNKDKIKYIESNKELDTLNFNNPSLIQNNNSSDYKKLNKSVANNSITSSLKKVTTNIKSTNNISQKYASTSNLHKIRGILNFNNPKKKNLKINLTNLAINNIDNSNNTTNLNNSQINELSERNEDLNSPQRSLIYQYEQYKQQSKKDFNYFDLNNKRDKNNHSSKTKLTNTSRKKELSLLQSLSFSCKSVKSKKNLTPVHFFNFKKKLEALSYKAVTNEIERKKIEHDKETEINRKRNKDSLEKDKETTEKSKVERENSSRYNSTIKRKVLCITPKEIKNSNTEYENDIERFNKIKIKSQSSKSIVRFKLSGNTNTINIDNKASEGINNLHNYTENIKKSNNAERKLDSDSSYIGNKLKSTGKSVSSSKIVNFNFNLKIKDRMGIKNNDSNDYANKTFNKLNYDADSKPKMDLDNSFSANSSIERSIISITNKERKDRDFDNTNKQLELNSNYKSTKTIYSIIKKGTDIINYNTSSLSILKPNIRLDEENSKYNDINVNDKNEKASRIQTNQLSIPKYKKLNNNCNYIESKEQNYTSLKYKPQTQEILNPENTVNNTNTNKIGRKLRKISSNKSLNTINTVNTAKANKTNNTLIEVSNKYIDSKSKYKKSIIDKDLVSKLSRNIFPNENNCIVSENTSRIYDNSNKKNFKYSMVNNQSLLHYHSILNKTKYKLKQFSDNKENEKQMMKELLSKGDKMNIFTSQKKNRTFVLPTSGMYTENRKYVRVRMNFKLENDYC